MLLKRKAKDIMTDMVIVAKEDMVITEAINLLLRWHISGLPVVDSEGNLVGIVTEHDLVNSAVSGDALDTKVSDVMTTNIETFSPNDLVVEVINHFSTYHHRRVPVVKKGKVIGIISRRDILRDLSRIYGKLIDKEGTETES